MEMNAERTIKRLRIEIMVFDVCYEGSRCVLGNFFYLCAVEYSARCKCSGTTDMKRPEGLLDMKGSLRLDG